MINRFQSELKIPLFFKLWFAFVATLAIATAAGTIWLVVQVIQAGPEGVGRTVGTIVRGFNEEVR